MTATTLRDLLASILRTVVPAAVGAGLTWLAVHFGLVLTPETAEAVKLGAGLIVTGLYYTAVRRLELRWPGVGVLLGWAVQPTYAGTVVRGEVVSTKDDPPSPLDPQY